jgi:spermidine/putrescine transport system permease protein
VTSFDDTLVFNSAYVSIFLRSIGLALGATIGALILGFPTAYFIASKPREQRNIWLFLITLPFWTNLLIRTYAMLLIIRDEGIINIMLMKAGIISSPLTILYTDTAVFIGLIYSFCRSWCCRSMRASRSSTSASSKPATIFMQTA